MDLQAAPGAWLDNHSSICSIGWTPTLVEGFIRQHLIAHFTSPRSIELPQLRDYLWTANFDTTKIMIESIGRWRPESASLRPAIITRRNEYTPVRISIGSRVFGFGNGQSVAYAEMGQGSLTLFCLAKLFGEAESLAIEVQREIHRFAPILSAWTNLLRLQIVEVGRPMPVAEAAGHFGVPVTLAYAHNVTWQIIPHAPVIRSIDLSVLAP